MTWAVVRLVGVSAPCAARLSGCAPCRNSRHGPSASILHACALRLPVLTGCVRASTPALHHPAVRAGYYASARCAGLLGVPSSPTLAGRSVGGVEDRKVWALSWWTWQAAHGARRRVDAAGASRAVATQTDDAMVVTAEVSTQAW